MKIRSMTARFGALDGDTLELSGGLNVLYAPNESGKSTWCAFIRAMLYGIDTSQRAKAGQKPDKTKYRPWNGAPMSGSMDIETDAGRITLRRQTEKDSQPMQAFSAVLTGTDIPAPGLTASAAGETLTGVTRAVFERSVFIRQAGMEMTNDPELDRRISAIVSSGDEGISFIDTEKRLKAWQRHRRSGKRGAIPETLEQMEDTRRALGDIRAHADAAAAAEEEIAHLERERAETVRRMERARADQRKKALEDLAAARLNVESSSAARQKAERALSEAESAVDEMCFDGVEPETAAQRAGADMDRAAELLDAAERTPSVQRAYLTLIPAALAFALAFFLPQRAVFLGAGAALLVLFAALYARLTRGHMAELQMLDERTALLARYGIEQPEELSSLLDEYETRWQDMERAEARLSETETALAAAQAAQKRTEARTINDLDFTNGDNEAARLGREAAHMQERLTSLRERRALAEGQARAIGEPMALESELAALETRLDALSRQEAAMQLALDMLTGADNELQQRLSPVLSKKAAEYFSALTDGRYDELFFARDLTGSARPAGDAVGRELDYLSAGTRDQLYLALRLALCDLALPQDAPCPIVLDDALTAFDQERMERALRLLRRMAEKRQVILFTCHTREGAFFADDPEVRVQTI